MAQALVGNGGRLIDTASSYGEAETVLGDVIAAAGLRDKLFIATKLEAPDAGEHNMSHSTDVVRSCCTAHPVAFTGLMLAL